MSTITITPSTADFAKGTRQFEATVEPRSLFHQDSLYLRVSAVNVTVRAMAITFSFEVDIRGQELAYRDRSGNFTRIDKSYGNVTPTTREYIIDHCLAELKAWLTTNDGQAAFSYAEANALQQKREIQTEYLLSHMQSLKAALVAALASGLPYGDAGALHDDCCIWLDQHSVCEQRPAWAAQLRYGHVTRLCDTHFQLIEPYKGKSPWEPIPQPE